MYLLDTNTCIQLLNEGSETVRQNMQAHPPSEIAICSVVKAELLYGARHSRRIEANLRLLERFFIPLASLSFDDRCAEDYAVIRAQLAAQGQPIGPNDLMIAATARTHDAVLVTHNHREFNRVAGLRLTDWEENESRTR